MLPESINIGTKNFSTMIVVLILGAISFGFILWSESKKDGFNSDKFFDMVFSSLIICGVLIYFLERWVNWSRIYNPSGVILYFDQDILLTFTSILIFFSPILVFSKKFKWSFFRIADIYSVGFSILIMVMSLGSFLIYEKNEYLITLFAFMGLHIYVMRHRGYRFISGVIFTIFLVFVSLIMTAVFRRGGYLLFAPILVTISVLNLYMRGKKTMSKILLPKDFISGLKKKLVSKEKRLEMEQKALIDNDPYLQRGRETDNAETLDDVMEDTGKTITDARLGIVRTAKIQVRKALTAIKLGSYGKCEVCGNAIDKARLEVYPEATTCIECATDHSQMIDVHEDEILEKNL